MNESLEYCLNELQISIPVLSTLTISLGLNIYLGFCKNYGKNYGKKINHKVKNEANISEKYLELKPIKGELPSWVIDDYKNQIEKKNSK